MSVSKRYFTILILTAGSENFINKGCNFFQFFPTPCNRSEPAHSRLPGDFPEEVAESIFNGLKETSERLSEID